MGRSGAVGGIDRDDLPQVIADLVFDRDQALEIWIRPERIGTGYTVEWTTVAFDSEEQEWRPATPENGKSDRPDTSNLLHGSMDHSSDRRLTVDVDRESINVFAVGDRYLFKAYFDEDDVFDVLRPYYNADDYRFEVPEDAFTDVRETLEAHFYEPVVIRDLKPFCVVYPKYTDHPSVLFKAAVLQRSHSDQHVFLMKDQRSVEQAVNYGATVLADSKIDESGFD